MTEAFTPKRADGRSDRSVVFDLVCDAEPDTVISYDQIIAALSVGSDSPADRHRAYQAATQANRTLLKERQRTLRNVRGKGYRIVQASEHVELALMRKERSEVQMRRGAELLDNVRMDEMSDAQRQVHLGYKNLFSGVISAIRHLEQKDEDKRNLIAELTKRVDRLEEEKAS